MGDVSITTLLLGTVCHRWTGTSYDQAVYKTEIYVLYDLYVPLL